MRVVAAAVEVGRGVDVEVVGRVGVAAFRELDGCEVRRGVEADG